MRVVHSLMVHGSRSRSRAYAASVLLSVLGCTRREPSSGGATVQADVPSASSAASAAPEKASAPTIDSSCTEFVRRNDSPEGFRCRGEMTHATCELTQKKALKELSIVEVHEKGPDATRTALAIVDGQRRFARVIEAKTEECDLGEPASVSLELVSALDANEGGAPHVQVVIESVRIDPPFQSGPPIRTVMRSTIRCRTSESGPICDRPTDAGSR